MPHIATPARLKPLIAQRQTDVDKVKAKRSAKSLAETIGERAPARGFTDALRGHFLNRRSLA